MVTHSGELAENSTDLIVSLLLKEINLESGLKPKKIVFEGVLGAGKTRIIRDLLHALNVSEEIVSPSYSLCHEYESSGRLYEHWDVFRLNTPPEELLRESDALQLIEWGDKFPEISPDMTVRLALKGAIREFTIYRKSV